MSGDRRPPLIVEVASASDAMVAVAGDLDASGLEVLREHVLRAVEEAGRPRVVIDWTGVAIAEPASLGALIAVAEELKASGHRVVLVGPTVTTTATTATTAPTSPLSEDVATLLIHRLFSLGRELTSAQSLLGPGDARRRLDAAVEDLTGLVRELRDAAPPPPSPPRPRAA